MLGVGATEFFILLAVALLLFGMPALLAFWIGYQAGSRKATAAKSAEQDAATQEAPSGSVEESEATTTVPGEGTGTDEE